MPVAKGIFFQERTGQLAIRPVNVRRHSRVDGPLLYVTDNTDNPVPRSSRTPPNALSDRALSRPEFLRGGETDNGDRFRSGTIFRVEPSALQQGDTHRLKIITDHPGLAYRLRSSSIIIDSAFDRHGNLLAAVQSQVTR